MSFYLIPCFSNYCCTPQLPTNTTAVYPDQLQYFQTETITNEECRKAHATLGRFIQSTTICTAHPIQSGVCYEDHGNPMVFDANRPRRELIGIVSWFVPCARGLPDVYVRIHPFVPWIKSIISQIE